MTRNTTRLSTSLILTFGSILSSSSLPILADPLSTSPSPHIQLCSMNTDHIYLYQPGGPLDVTGTLFTCQGQTYVVANSNTIPVYLDYNAGGVYNMSGVAIGFIYPRSSNQLPDNQMPGKSMQVQFIKTKMATRRIPSGSKSNVLPIPKLSPVELTTSQTRLTVESI